jgi:hypothetical protein
VPCGRAIVLGVVALVAAGCPPPGPHDDPGGPADTEVAATDTDPAAAPSYLRRLSVSELDATLNDLVGHPAGDAQRLMPADPQLPFDDVVEYQEPSAVWVESAETLAGAVTDALLADPARFATVVGCAPDVADPAPCLDAWLPAFLRRALRRELLPGELADWQALARSAFNPTLGAQVDTVLRAALQDPEFLYRTEQARSVDDPTLTPGSIASKMSFLLWGTGPDDALLEAAATGRLDAEEGRRAEATRLLADPRARTQVLRFHRQWLGYTAVNVPEEYRQVVWDEADLFIGRVLFDDAKPWPEVLTGTTMPVITPMLEPRHLTAPPDAPADPFAWFWMDTEASGWGGVLSTSTWLNATSHSLDTSPTLRGKAILERLMCSPVGTPPPGARADSPPPAGDAECKSDRYAQHRTDPACASCHLRMDGLGTGLERYDRDGFYREYEYAMVELFSKDPNYDCPIPEGGTIPGVGDFTTVLDLGRKLAASGLPQACLVEHLVGFERGLRHGSDDQDLVDAWQAKFEAQGFRLDRLLVEIVADPAFVRLEAE